MAILSEDNFDLLTEDGDSLWLESDEPLVAPVLSLVSRSPAGITLAWTPATGGTAPYDYGIYRDGSLLVDGQTSPFFVAGVTSGTFTIVATDASNDTVASNAIQVGSRGIDLHAVQSRESGESP